MFQFWLKWNEQHQINNHKLIQRHEFVCWLVCEWRMGRSKQSTKLIDGRCGRHQLMKSIVCCLRHSFIPAQSTQSFLFLALKEKKWRLMASIPMFTINKFLITGYKIIYFWFSSLGTLYWVLLILYHLISLGGEPFNFLFMNGNE